jgi:hypothetical protein
LENGIDTQEDWYGVQLDQILKSGGSGLVSQYNNSIITALKNVFPEFEWFNWKFPHTSHGFWNSLENQQVFFKSLEEQLGITNTSDWYNIRYTDIWDMGGSQYLFNTKFFPFCTKIFAMKLLIVIQVDCCAFITIHCARHSIPPLHISGATRTITVDI